MLCYTQSRTMTRTLPIPPPTHPSHCIHYVLMSPALRTPHSTRRYHTRKSFAGSGIRSDHSQTCSELERGRARSLTPSSQPALDAPFRSRGTRPDASVVVEAT